MTRFGKYTLLATLGRGGMGEVFLARAPADALPVVIKRVLPELATDDESLRSFLDETRVAARLRHPHIVRIDELGQVEGDWYVRMEYVAGASLSQVLRALGKAGRKLGLELALSIASAVARALEHAHAARDAEGRPLHVVHRDVTPQNVLLGRGGEVKLIDFGVARVEQRARRQRPELVKGKMAYMPPEQAEGLAIDHRVDLFALGVCLWEMLTGLRLFHGETPQELYARVLMCQVPVPSVYRAEVPPELDELVLRALAREPEQRFQGGADLAEALETVASQYGLEAPADRLGALVRQLFPEATPPPIASDEAATTPLHEPLETLGRHGPRPPAAAEVMLTPTVPSSPRPRGFASVQPELVGRAGELADLHQLLGGGARLVTLTGPGGVGKSALARAVALQQTGTFGEQVAFADAGAAREVEGLCVAVAEAFGVALPPGADAVAGTAALLKARRRCLVVLDQVDHLLPEVRAALGAWVPGAPEATLLVVSRSTTELEAEESYVIGPLRLEAVPGAESDAEALFLRRVAEASPKAAGAVPKEAVRELVRRLEGMPLAIELAAALVAEAPREALLRLLDDDSGGGLTGVHDALESSWRMLTRDEQEALVHCTVFEAGFTAEAAVAVLRRATARPDSRVALLVLHRLRRSSLVRVTYSATSEHPRFSMYESIRARVLGRLPEEEAAARRRHAEYFLRLGERLGEGAERGAGVLDALATERENLVAAWRYWMGQGEEGARQALRVLLALDSFFIVRGPYGAQLSMLDACLQALQAPVERAPALEARARVLLTRGRLEAAAIDLEALLATPGDAARRARAIAYLGLLRRQQGNLGESVVLFERALGELKAAGDRRMEGRVLAHLGGVAQEQGRLEEARALYERAIAVHADAGDRRFEAITLSNLATLQQVRGAWEEAEASLQRALSLHRALGNRRSEGIALANLGELERDRGSGARAIAHFQRSVKISREVGNQRFEAISLLNHALLLLERREGRAAEELLDEVLSLCLAVGDRRHAALARGARGALRAWRGKPGGAEDVAAALEALGAAGDVAFRAAVELYAVQVELARASALDAAGNDVEAQAAREVAAGRVAAAVATGPEGSPASRFEHVRMALRVLKAFSR